MSNTLFTDLLLMKAASKGLQEFVAKLATHESWLFWSVAALPEYRYHPQLTELLLWNKFYYAVKLFKDNINIENMFRIGHLYEQLCEVYGNYPCITEKRDVKLVFTSNNKTVANIKVTEEEVAEATAELFKFFDGLGISTTAIEARGFISARTITKIVRNKTTL